MFTNTKILRDAAILICVIFIVSEANASSVRFEAAPTQLKSNLTEALSMRCDVTDGHDVTGTNGTGSHDVNVHQVMSIYVTYKDDADVASITSTDAAMTYVDAGNLESKGSISGTSGEGYLQLTWSDPSQAWLGEYTCTVAAVDVRGHIVQMTSQLTLTEAAPSINDLIGFFNSKIENLEKDNVVQQQQITILEQDNAKLKTCMLQKVAFTAAYDGTGRIDINPSTSSGIVKFGQVILNEGSDFDVSSGLFKCTIPGLYSFTLHIVDPSGTYVACLTLQQNDVRIASMYGRTEGDNIESASMSFALMLKKGDTVGVYDMCNTHIYQDNNQAYRANVFSGHLVTPEQCV